MPSNHDIPDRVSVTMPLDWQAAADCVTLLLDVEKDWGLSSEVVWSACEYLQITAEQLLTALRIGAAEWDC